MRVGWPLKSPKELWETVALDSTGGTCVGKGRGRGRSELISGGLDLLHAGATLGGSSPLSGLHSP